eukprot:6053338-Pyramimonas_sp.AAC.1
MYQGLAGGASWAPSPARGSSGRIGQTFTRKGSYSHPWWATRSPGVPPSADRERSLALASADRDRRGCGPEVKGWLLEVSGSAVGAATCGGGAAGGG